MIARSPEKRRGMMLLWWLGALVSTVTILAHPFRHGYLDLSRRSPFDNTGSGHAEQWVFLQRATPHVPPAQTFTVLANDRETEMSLSMMSVGLIPEAQLLPTSYYGEPVDAGAGARFVLEFGIHLGPESDYSLVTTLPGGRLLQRRLQPP